MKHKFCNWTELSYSCIFITSVILPLHCNRESQIYHRFPSSSIRTVKTLHPYTVTQFSWANSGCDCGAPDTGGEQIIQKTFLNNFYVVFGLPTRHTIILVATRWNWTISGRDSIALSPFYSAPRDPSHIKFRIIRATGPCLHGVIGRAARPRTTHPQKDRLTSCPNSQATVSSDDRYCKQVGSRFYPRNVTTWYGCLTREIIGSCRTAGHSHQ